MHLLGHVIYLVSNTAAGSKGICFPRGNLYSVPNRWPMTYLSGAWSRQSALFRVETLPVRVQSLKSVCKTPLGPFFSSVTILVKKARSGASPVYHMNYVRFSSGIGRVEVEVKSRVIGVNLLASTG